MDRIKKAQITQQYLAEYADKDKPRLDPKEERTSLIFEGAINYASWIFINRLMLGGAYETNKSKKMEILDHLKAITNILENKGA